VKIGIYIAIKSATIAGHDKHGWQVVDLPANALSQEDRQTLADEGASGGREDWQLRTNAYLPEGCPKEPLAVVADHAAVSAWLGWMRAVRKFIDDGKRADEEARVKQWHVIRDAIVADPIGCVKKHDQFGTDFYFDIRVGESDVYQAHPVRERSENDPALKSALALADQEVVRLTAVEASRRAAVVIERDAKKASAHAARIAAIDWLVSTGTPSQIERQKDGVLPMSEVLDLLRRVVLRRLLNQPKYEKIVDSDLPACDGDVRYDQNDLVTLTEGQHSAIKCVRLLLESMKTLGCWKVTYTITAQCHTATGTDCDNNEQTVERHSLRIEATIDETDLTVSRLLDLDALSKEA